MTDSEEYRILWEVLESELRRFWSGYHTLLILKVGIISGMMTLLTNSAQNITTDVTLILYLTATIFLMIISSVSILINNRAQYIYTTFSKAIKAADANRGGGISRLIKNTKKTQIDADFPYAMKVGNIIPIIILNLSTILFFYIITEAPLKSATIEKIWFNEGYYLTNTLS